MKPQVKIHIVNSKLTLTRGFVMASAIKIIYLLQQLTSYIKCLSIVLVSVHFSTLHRKMSCSKPKHQHVDHTLKEKLQILNKLECGMKAINVCKEFNLSQSTLSTWKKQNTKLKDNCGCRKSP